MANKTATNNNIDRRIDKKGERSMKQELICIVCPQGCRLLVEERNGSYQVSGNTCKRGEQYGITEMTAPTRVITSTVCLKGGRYPRLPVKTNRAIPKKLIFDCMEQINQLTVYAPVKMGDVILKNVLDTGIDIISCRSAKSNEK